MFKRFYQAMIAFTTQALGLQGPIQLKDKARAWHRYTQFVGSIKYQADILLL